MTVYQVLPLQGDQVLKFTQDKYQQFYSTPMRPGKLYETEKSIGCSGISGLISATEPRRASEIYSLYSTVNKTEKKKRPDARDVSVSNAVFDSSDTMTITNDDSKSVSHLSVNPKEGELLSENALQREIIHQISKALLICRSQSTVITRDVHVEAEKILLVATCKKNLINEKLNQIYNEETDNLHTSIEITIKNLKFSKSGTVSDKYNKKCSWYFVCVLQSGTTTIASKVVESEATEIYFPDCFQFEGHTHDFEIDVSLYALVLKNDIKKKNKNCLKMTTSQLTDYAPTHSFFTLWGKTQMRTCQITQRAQNVYLSKDPAEASISNAFTADVETSLKINITMKGFLTIRANFKGYPVWNRRWCVLEGSRMNYWNNPNEEPLMAPIGQLDLLKTHTHQVGVVDKELCPRPRTLSLEVRVEGHGPAIREYFLSADSLSEFEEWSRQLNLVLGYLRKWENILCYLNN
ncbi:hypothetical protein JTB14_034125 [Gonioctena quinquepunctata]|nr:hypothetical protein JTB14_034125 [Gonioctena quinquepunctata]